MEFVNNDILYALIVVFYGAALNSNLPFLTPETAFFTCFGVDAASLLAQEWLGSKGGLVKNQKFLSPNLKR